MLSEYSSLKQNRKPNEDTRVCVNEKVDVVVILTATHWEKATTPLPLILFPRMANELTTVMLGELGEEGYKFLGKSWGELKTIARNNCVYDWYTH